jgi:hypothetical protein
VTIAGLTDLTLQRTPILPAKTAVVSFLKQASDDPPKIAIKEHGDFGSAQDNVRPSRQNPHAFPKPTTIPVDPQRVQSISKFTAAV